MIDPLLAKWLRENEYFFIREVPGRGVCAVSLEMVYTVPLFYGIDQWGRAGRYCYPDLWSAVAGLESWDGVADPAGPWIEHKGRAGEYDNPNLPKDTFYR